MSTEQAVIVHLNGRDLPDSVYQEYDLVTIEEQLIDAIDRAGVGEYDGNEFGPEETLLFMYGPDAEKLFATIEPLIRSYPLCRGAKVVVRSGPPGATERQLFL